jgi:4-hydroxy-tetrahydrodipicolinate synthase
MSTFGRLLTAMVTPFTSGGEVDYVQAKKLAQSLLDSGSDGIVVSGTTGECPTLTIDEKLRLFAEIKSVAGNRGAVIAGTGSYSTVSSIELTRQAEKTGVDGCLLVVPYYSKPTQEGLYFHFRAIADSTSLPCILYNVPSRTVTNLAAETAVRLSKIDNIVGIKEASANLSQIADIIQRTGDDFIMYSGNDSDTLPVLALGGYGVISVISHIVGMQVRQMIESYLNGNANEAARIHRALLPLVDALFVVGNPMPVKYALNHIGFPVGKPRLPLTEPDEKNRAYINDVLGKYTVDLRFARIA